MSLVDILTNLVWFGCLVVYWIINNTICVGNSSEYIPLIASLGSCEQSPPVQPIRAIFASSGQILCSLLCPKEGETTSLFVSWSHNITRTWAIAPYPDFQLMQEPESGSVILIANRIRKPTNHISSQTASWRLSVLCCISNKSQCQQQG